MPTADSSRTCAVCGEPINGDCYSHVRYRHKSCHNKTQEAKRKAAMYASRAGRKCAHCGGDIPIKKPSGTKYCSKKCKESSRGDRSEYRKQYRDINRSELNRKARLYMNDRRKKDESFKERQREARVRWKANNPDKVRIHRSMETRNLAVKHNQHVKDWNGIVKRKFNAHVIAFKKHKSKASNHWHKKHFKDVGRPWANPRLTCAQQYKIRYHLDVEFKLGEINRQSWRKEQLKARNDNTIDFAKLMRERKTCPYCGCQITKENAVADHMDPLSRGGANSDHNLTICCRTCNTKKAAKPFVDWVAMLPANRREAARRWYRRKHGHRPEDHHQGFVFEFAA